MANGMSEEEDVLEELVSADVLKQIDDDELELTQEFLGAYDRTASELDGMSEDERRTFLQQHLSGMDRGDTNVDDRTISLAIALREFIPDLTPGQALRIATSLNRFFDPPPRDGVPDGFVLVRPLEVDAFFEKNDVTVLYVYRDDSSTCSTVCDILGELSRGVLDRSGVGLGAMYGPDGTSYLRDELDVQMSPTVLVLDGDDVVLRLVGPYEQEYFDDELSRAISASI